MRPRTASAADLGAALERLVFSGDTTPRPDVRSCLVASVHRAGLSRAAQEHLVATQADDLGAVAVSLRENVDPALPSGRGGSDALLDRALRRDLDGCVDRAVLGELGDDAATPPEGRYPPPDRAVAGMRPPRTPDLTPRYEVNATTLITVVPQLTEGLVSVFESYALDDTQREVYRAAGPCLAGAVLSARDSGTSPTSTASRDGGFTQDALRFLAGGPSIGTGSLAKHLPHEADRVLWRSASLQSALQRCVTAAQTAPSPHTPPTTRATPTPAAAPPTASPTGD